jgi:hypothetical protein
VSLKLSLQIVLIIVNDALVGHWDEDFLSGLIGEIMNSVVDVIVESKGPFKFESAGFADILFVRIVLFFVHGVVTEL